MPGQLEISQEFTSIGHLDGHLHEMFRWSIEFDRLLGKDEITLCIRHWIAKDDSTYPRIVSAAGHVVSVSIAGKGLVSIVLEDDYGKRWVKICLPVRKFSTLLNVEWIAQGEVSLASMGFFSKSMTPKKFIIGSEILPVELVYGFQFIKTYVMRNPLTVEPLRS